MPFDKKEINIQREFRNSLSLHLEMMAAAYLKATNIPIEECELVVKTLSDKIVYSFRRRANNTIFIDCPKCGEKGLMSAYLNMCTCCANKERGY